MNTMKKNTIKRFSNMTEAVQFALKIAKEKRTNPPTS